MTRRQGEQIRVRQLLAELRNDPELLREMHAVLREAGYEQFAQIGEPWQGNAGKTPPEYPCGRRRQIEPRSLAQDCAAAHLQLGGNLRSRTSSVAARPQQSTCCSVHMRGPHDMREHTR
jgi:hypothetical protein